MKDEILMILYPGATECDIELIDDGKADRIMEVFERYALRVISKEQRMKISYEEKKDPSFPGESVAILSIEGDDFYYKKAGLVKDDAQALRMLEKAVESIKRGVHLLNK